MKIKRELIEQLTIFIYECPKCGEINYVNNFPDIDETLICVDCDEEILLED